MQLIDIPKTPKALNISLFVINICLSVIIKTLKEIINNKNILLIIRLLKTIFFIRLNIKFF